MSYLLYCYTRHRFTIFISGILGTVVVFLFATNGKYESGIDTDDLIILAIALSFFQIPFSLSGSLERLNNKYVYRYGLETQGVITAIHHNYSRISSSDTEGIDVSKYDLAFKLKNGKTLQSSFYDPPNPNSWYPTSRGFPSPEVGQALKIRYITYHPNNFILINEAYAEFDKRMAERELLKEAEKKRALDSLELVRESRTSS